MVHNDNTDESGSCTNDEHMWVSIWWLYQQQIGMDRQAKTMVSWGWLRGKEFSDNRTRSPTREAEEAAMPRFPWLELVG